MTDLPTLSENLRAEEKRLAALRNVVDRAVEFCGRMDRDGCSIEAHRVGRFGFSLTVEHGDVGASLLEAEPVREPAPVVDGGRPYQPTPVEGSITTEPAPNVVCVNQEQDAEAIRGKPADGPVEPCSRRSAGSAPGARARSKCMHLRKEIAAERGEVRETAERVHDDGPCPVSDPDCMGDDGDCHDACDPLAAADEERSSEEPGEPAEQDAEDGSEEAAPAAAEPTERVNRPKPPELGASVGQFPLPELRDGWTREIDLDLVRSLTAGEKTKVWAARHGVDLLEARRRFWEYAGNPPQYEQQMQAYRVLKALVEPEQVAAE